MDPTSSSTTKAMALLWMLQLVLVSKYGPFLCPRGPWAWGTLGFSATLKPQGCFLTGQGGSCSWHALYPQMTYEPVSLFLFPNTIPEALPPQLGLSPFIFLFFNILLNCAHMCGCACASALKWRSENNLQKPVLSFYHVLLGTRIQVNSLDSRCLYPLPLLS